MAFTEAQIFEMPSLFSESSLVHKGLCPVTKLKKDDSIVDSHSLYFEQHGYGPKKLLFIMGIKASAIAWRPQVEHFGDRLGDEYTVLVFDNRASGYSGTPRGPYSTSEMAEDVIMLLDFVGWTNDRDFHVVTHSLGGMIGQELAYRIPNRINSLLLCSTSAEGGLPPLRGMLALLKSLPVSDPKKKFSQFAALLYSDEYLNETVPNDTKGRKWIDVQTERHLLAPPQSLPAVLYQMTATLTHRVTPSRLQYISSSIPKITILTGKVDKIVNPKNSEYLAQNMKGSELLIWEEDRHAVNTQNPKRFNELIESVVEDGCRRVADGWVGAEV